jgi:hypothetical protein
LVLYEDVYDTRNKTSLYLHPVHNEFGKRSLTFSGFQMFNRLSLELKFITRLLRFKNEFKKYDGPFFDLADQQGILVLILKTYFIF